MRQEQWRSQLRGDSFPFQVVQSIGMVQVVLPQASPHRGLRGETNVQPDITASSSGISICSLTPELPPSTISEMDWIILAGETCWPRLACDKPASCRTPERYILHLMNTLPCLAPCPQARRYSCCYAPAVSRCHFLQRNTTRFLRRTFLHGCSTTITNTTRMTR
jgi:hypothetical protein